MGSSESILSKHPASIAAKKAFTDWMEESGLLNNPETDANIVDDDEYDEAQPWNDGDDVPIFKPILPPPPVDGGDAVAGVNNPDTNGNIVDDDDDDEAQPWNDGDDVPILLPSSPPPPADEAPPPVDGGDEAAGLNDTDGNIVVDDDDDEAQPWNDDDDVPILLPPSPPSPVDEAPPPADGGDAAESDRKLQPQEEEKWYNPDPLPGPPDRPAVIFTNLLSKSPKMIDWDDELFERRARETLESRGGSMEDLDKDVVIGPKRDVVDGPMIFGLVEMITDAITDYLLKPRPAVDGEQEQQQRVEGGLAKREALSAEKNSVAEDQVSEMSSTAAAPDGGEKECEGEEESESWPNMKETDFYQRCLTSLQWQRDTYLAGPSYADTRRDQRKKQRHTAETHPDLPKYYHALLEKHGHYARPDGDPNAAGNIHLLNLTKDFIPSKTVQDAVRPIVLWLPGPLGPLRGPIRNGILDVIVTSQNQLDGVTKDSVLDVLRNEQFRRNIKNSTEGYIGNAVYREENTRESQKRRRR